MTYFSKTMAFAVCVASFMTATVATAEEYQKPAELRANFRRVGLEMSSTKVSNARNMKIRL